MTVPYCVNCKHCRGERWCEHPRLTPINVVTGIPYQFHFEAYHQRQPIRGVERLLGADRCGHTGRYYEAKDGA